MSCIKQKYTMFVSHSNTTEQKKNNFYQNISSIIMREQIIKSCKSFEIGNKISTFFLIVKNLVAWIKKIIDIHK